MPKQVNPNRVKTHRSYTVEEAAAVIGVHKNTVRQWIKSGLPVCDDRRPSLILGRELRAFLQRRRQSGKTRCQPGEMYCLRCRAPRRPAGDMVDYTSTTALSGRLVAMCPSCNSMMNRYVNRAALAWIQAHLEVSIPTVGEHIGDSSEFPLNSDFNQGQ